MSEENPFQGEYISTVDKLHRIARKAPLVPASPYDYQQNPGKPPIQRIGRDAEKKDVERFVREANTNPILYDHRVGVYDNRTVTFFKVGFYLMLIIFLAGLLYLAWNDKFTPQNTFNPTTNNQYNMSTKVDNQYEFKPSTNNQYDQTTNVDVVIKEIKVVCGQGGCTQTGGSNSS